MYSNEIVLKLLDYIDNNINKKITMDELSRLFYFNKDYLMRIFKKELDVTIMDYINKRRIYNSLEELKNTDYSMVKIAMNNGYASQEYFSETFSKIIGVNPLTYRKFTKVNSNISENDYEIIRRNLTEINTILRFIDRYKNNIPSMQVKKIAFFK